MINLYHRMAVLLYPWRFTLLGLSVVALAASGLVVADIVTIDAAAFKPLLLLGVWLLLLVSISYSFSQVPEQASPDSGLIYRWQCKLKRFFCWIFAVVFTLVTLIAILFSVKALLLGG